MHVMLVDQRRKNLEVIMSSGPFVRSLYSTDLLNVVRIRVQPETLALVLNAVANDPPAGPATAGFPSAKVSLNNSEVGINPRNVTIAYTAGASAGLEGLTVSLPWCVKSTFDALPEDATGTYKTEPVELVSKSNERIR